MNTINHIEYPKSLKSKSIESLRFIIKDAKEALKANPNSAKAGYYADEICYAGMELKARQTL